MKDTLFHINWGDGDTTFVIAPDEKTAKERMGDGEDMVNSMVRLDHLYQMIYNAGQREVVELIRGNIYGRVVDKEHIHKLRVEIPLIEWEAFLQKGGL